MQANMDIRLAAKSANVPLWRVGEALGKPDYSFSRMLRHELDEATKEKILSFLRREAKHENET